MKVICALSALGRYLEVYGRRAILALTLLVYRVSRSPFTQSEADEDCSYPKNICLSVSLRITVPKYCSQLRNFLSLQFAPFSFRLILHLLAYFLKAVIFIIIFVIIIIIIIIANIFLVSVLLCRRILS